MTTRRATYQIQAELKLANQQCQFKRDWVTHCVQFFSRNETQIEHIPYSYKIFSLALLYYVIRSVDNSIMLDFYNKNVVKKCAPRNVRQIRPIYKKLCWLFGHPKEIDSAPLQHQIVEFISEKHPDLKAVLDLEKNEIRYSPHIANDKQLNAMLFPHLKKYRVCQKKELYQVIRKAFADMQIL